LLYHFHVSLFPDQHLYILKNMCMYTYICLCRDYVKCCCYQITLQWNIFTQIGSSVKCWLDIYSWGTSMVVVTGRICDIGQNVLQSSFQTRSCSGPQLLPHFAPYYILQGGVL
jgi:hypothetical protein